MISTIARIVTRPVDAKRKEVDLFIGVAIKGQKELKPNRVYELREVLGEIMLVDLGPSAIGLDQSDSVLATNWSHGIGNVLGSAGNSVVLTKDEALKQIAGHG